MKSIIQVRSEDACLPVSDVRKRASSLYIDDSKVEALSCDCVCCMWEEMGREMLDLEGVGKWDEVVLRSGSAEVSVCRGTVVGWSTPTHELVMRCKLDELKM